MINRGKSKMDGHMSKWTVHESQTERFKRLKVNMDKTGRPKRLSLESNDIGPSAKVDGPEMNALMA